MAISWTVTATEPMLFLSAGALFQWYVWRHIRRHDTEEGSVDNGLAHRLMFVAYVTYFLGAGVEYLRHGSELNEGCQVLGMALYLGAAFVKIKAIRALDDMASVHVKTFARHRLVTTGPYAYVRHPMLLAILFEIVAIALVTGALRWTAVWGVVVVIGVAFRLSVEERQLERLFGSEYVQYRQTAGALWPRRQTITARWTGNLRE